MEATYNKGIELFKAHKYDEAISIFEIVTQREPANFYAAYTLGVCYFRMDQLNKAKDQFVKAISLNERFFKAFYHLGLTLERQGQIEKAIPQYKMALSINPNFIEAKNKLISFGELKEDLATSIDVDKGNFASKIDTGVVSTDRSVLVNKVAGEFIERYNRRMSSYGYPFLIPFIILLIMVPLSLGWIMMPDTSTVGMPFDWGELPSISLIWIEAPGILISAILWSFVYIKSLTTSYEFYENRIDFKSGIFNKVEHSLWNYEIQDTWLTRSLPNLLTGDATVHFRASYDTKESMSPTAKPGHFEVSGLGNYSFMRKFREEVRDAALIDRRAMKKWWI